MEKSKKPETGEKLKQAEQKKESIRNMIGSLLEEIKKSIQYGNDSLNKILRMNDIHNLEKEEASEIIKKANEKLSALRQELLELGSGGNSKDKIKTSIVGIDGLVKGEKEKINSVNSDDEKSASQQEIPDVVKEVNNLEQENKENEDLKKLIKDISNEINRLESLRGEELEKYYWEKRGITAGDLKTVRDMAQRQGLAAGLNFSQWQNAEMERLYRELKEQEGSGKLEINEDDDKKTGRTEQEVDEFSDIRREETGIDGWSHRITPFTSAEPVSSVIEHEDPDEDEPFVPTPSIKDPIIDPIPVPPIPVPRQPENMSRKINVVSIDRIVRSYAQRMSEDEVRRLVNAHQEEMSTGTNIKRFWNTVSAFARHPVKFAKKSFVRRAEDGYRMAFEHSIIEHITENQNLMMEIEGSWRLGRPLQVTEGNIDVNYEILNKIISEHAANDQERTEVGEAITNPIVNARFQELISRYCLSNDMPKEHFEIILRDEVALMKEEGLISDENFLGRQRSARGEKHEGFMYASNLFAVAEEYKNMVDARINEIKQENNLRPEQEDAVRAHVQSTLKLDIQLGSKMADLHHKQEGRNNFIERGISFMQTNPILRKIPINPGTLAIVGSYIGNVATQGVGGKVLKMGAGAAIGATVMTGALAPILGAALVGGTYAYFRKSKEVKQDDGMHKRNKTLGRDYTGKGKREIHDRFQYDTRSTTELMAELDTLIAKGNYAALGEAERAQLAEMFARFKVELNREHEYSVNGGENKTVDLISVDEAEGDKYGTNIMSKTDLKMKLWGYLRQNNLIAAEDRYITDQDFESLVTDSYTQFEDNIKQADARMNSYRRRSAMTSAAISAAGAAVTGIAFQEAWAHISENINGKSSFTALDAVFHPEKINAIYSEINGTKLTPGLHEVPLKDSLGKEQIAKLFVSENGAVDPGKSELPKGWLADFTNGKIIAPGHEVAHDISKDLSVVGETRHISTHGWYDQHTSPEKGLRGLVETAKNMAHNLGLRANKTELLMDFTVDKDGSVELDLTKFLGKTLKGRGLHDTEITQLIERGGVKLNFAIDNSIGGTQNHPLSIDVNDLKTKVSDKIAKLFTEIKNGKVQTKGLITLTVDDGDGSNGSKEVISLASSFKEFGNTIVKTTIEGVSYDIKPGEELYMPPVYGAGPTPRGALEGRTIDNKKAKAETVRKRPSDNLNKAFDAGIGDSGNSSGRNPDFKIENPPLDLEDEIVSINIVDRSGIKKEKNETTPDRVESYLTQEEKELNDEFDDITDEVYGLRGEGQRNSLNHLYERARKLGSIAGVALMEKIQVELDKLNNKISNPEVSEVVAEKIIDKSDINNEENEMLESLREMSNKTLNIEGINLPEESFADFAKHAGEVIRAYKLNKPNSVGDMIARFQRKNGVHDIHKDNLYSAVYYLALLQMRFKETEFKAEFKSERNRITNRRDRMMKVIKLVADSIREDLRAKKGVMDIEQTASAVTEAQIEEAPVPHLEDKPVKESTIETGSKLQRLDLIFADKLRLFPGRDTAEITDKTAAAVEVLAEKTIKEFDFNMEFDPVEMKKIVKEYIGISYNFSEPLEASERDVREKNIKKAIYFYAFQEERLQYAEYKLKVAENPGEKKSAKAEIKLVKQRMKGLKPRIKKAIKSRKNELNN